MADNLTTQAVAPATPPAATIIATRDVTYSGDAHAQIAPVGLVTFSGSDDAKTATDVSMTAPLPVAQGTYTGSAPDGTTVTGSDAQILAANANRRALFIVNISSDIIYLAFGATAVVGKGIALYPGGVFGPFPNTTQAVRAISAGTSSAVTIQEWT